MERPGDPAGLDFLTGGGAMGKLMREHDWSQSPLGEPSTWPQSLRTVTNLCLNSRFPILVWWGPQLAMIYNDGYVPMLGDKHPAALGAPGREVWSEIWHVIAPMLDGVLQEGRATWSQDQLLLMTRAGYEEETYFTWSYSPIVGDTGSIDGVFCAVTETTSDVMATRRLRVLADVAERAGQEDDPHAVAGAAIAALDGNADDVPFALLYELAGDDVSLVAAAGVTPATKHRLSHRDVALAPVDRTGVAVPSGIELADPTLPMPSLALVLPLDVGGHDTWRLVLGVPPRLLLDDDLRRFYELLAAAIGTAISAATALELERQRSEALQELDRVKNDFFANISHEFRTPLTLMLAPLESEIARRPEDERERLELAHRNALRLLRLVNALLDFSRAEAGRIEVRPRPIDLAALTAQLAAAFHTAIELAGLELRIEVDELRRPVQADPELWERILLNLMSNALKHTFDGAIVVRAREDGDVAVVEVCDTGVGIPAEHQDRVFERFHRVPEARSRSHEGSGIGLALVADLLAAQGGSVTVAESEDGVGTVFAVRLPLSDEVDVAAVQRSPLAEAYVQEVLRWDDITDPDAPTAADREAGAPRLLFVDDNADMRDYVSGLLSPYLEVEVVADGEQALEVLRGERDFDLVLSDVMMPRLDGLGMLAAIRADDALRQIPVVLLSARAGAEASVEALDAGADDYIVKPFTAPELLARVRSTLELARSRNREADLQREHAGRMEALYEREHRVAEALQRSLLPRELPAEPFLSVTGRYIAAEDVAVVGGDWYDGVVLGDGSLVLAIGDVAGHGLRAAAVMGQLRSGTRGYALRGDEPERLLASLNNLAHALDGRPMATCQVLRIDPARRRLQVASAGHPPGYVIRPDGSLTQLRGKGPPLGVSRSATWSTETFDIEDGSTLVLYTDGLIERRDETLDAGFARLEGILGELDVEEPEEFANGLVSGLRPDAGFADDVAVMVCRLGPVSPDRLELELEAHPGSLAVVRRALGRWLEANDVDAAEAYDSVLAVDESASNVIEHAYGPGEGTVLITAERHDGALLFDVRDRGGWRGPRGEHRGRGLPTMRRLMHEVDVATGEGGTWVRLVRRLGEPIANG